MNRIPVYQDPKNEVLQRGLDLLMSTSESSAADLLALVEAEEEKERGKAKPRPHKTPSQPPQSKPPRNVISRGQSS